MFEYFPERYNMTPKEIMETPTPTVWYLYERYLLYLHQMAKELPGDAGKDMLDTDMVKEEMFGNWNEVHAPPDWKKNTAPPVWATEGNRGVKDG